MPRCTGEELVALGRRGREHRGLDGLADDAEGEPSLELARPGAERSDVCRLGSSNGRLQESGLADAGRPVDDCRAALA